MGTPIAILAQTDAGSLAGTLLFYVFAGLAAASAVGVVVSRNIVRTSVMLMFTLVAVAGLYFLLGSEFLAAVQLVVYAGATLILIIFGVMLTSKSPFSRFEPSKAEVAVGLSIGAVMLVALVASILALPTRAEPAAGASEYPVARLGTLLLGDYLVPFELASVLLLLTMIGAAYLAKGRRDRVRTGDTPSALSQQARQWS
jgi:NADH-quinone oxidoreductase subunit J